jgi:glutaconate CoA-transferase subunit A
LHTDIFKISSLCEKISFLGEDFCAIKAVNPDICIIHAHKSDNEGNISIIGPDFSEIEMAQASKITIFSIEEIGNLNSNEITIPKDFVNYVILAKNGAFPTGCNGFYPPNIKKIEEIRKNE